MDDVVSTFPLMRLPNNAILNTLRSMNLLQVFGISVLSMKAKRLAKSLKLTATVFSVIVTSCFDVWLYFPNYHSLLFQLYDVRRNEPLQELGTPENIRILYERMRVTWENLMSAGQLLEHLQFIFHNSSYRLTFGYNCELFSPEGIQKNVKGFKSIDFISGNHEQNRKLLNVLQPALLELASDSLDEGHIPRDISIQNSDVIRVENVQITLDDLLMTNARSSRMICDRLSIKIPNRFLKLWVKGSNPRLEFLDLRFRSPEFQREDLLGGLKYQYVPRNIRRFFKVHNSNEKPEAIIGGWDIWRFDGTHATITCRRNDGLVYFNFFVWHDHCVVN